MRMRLGLAMLVLWCAWPRSAVADQVVLAASADNTLYEDAAGSLSNGAGQYLFAGATADGPLRRAVLRFDLVGIPAGSLITGVQLELQMSRTRAGVTDVSLHRLLADWGEGASAAGGEEGGGGTAMNGDATWIHTFYPASQWAAAGGDHASTPSATSAVADVGAYVWASTPSLVADVQDWLDGVAPNHGWILIGLEAGTRTAKRFDSREHATAANRPRLTVDFTPPSVGACCAADGSCSEVDAGACGGSFQGVGTQCGAGGVCGACCDGPACALAVADSCMQYQGDAVSCDPDPCPAAPTGACCAADGSCSELEAAACGGSYQGDGTQCGAGGVCGACCDGPGCSLAVAASCTLYQGDAVSCDPDPCPLPPTGACCAGDGSCSEVEAAACGGSYQGDGTLCGVGGVCGACCDGADCQLAVAAACGAYLGDGTTCAPGSCSSGTGACCQGASCSDGVTASECQSQGGSYQGDDQACSSDPCGDESRACCFPDASCVVMNRDLCETMGGDDQGGDSTCYPSPCGPKGACCLPEGCEDRTPAECAFEGGSYVGDEVACLPDPCGAPCDVNQIGPIRDLKAVKVSVSDLLLSWSPEPAASGYNTWLVGQKGQIPSARSGGSAMPVPGCEGRTAADCIHVGGVPGAAGSRGYYNVLGVCNGMEAAN